jgi:diaminohydroxyphosphoribosylaminopyrimidine deaminase/5-amino-6-(5-phosphoribosylamino)uracil reductase
MICSHSTQSNLRRRYLNDRVYIERALRLARRGYGATSPNPMVGAILVKGGKIIGQGWHRRAGEPHAEIEALRDAARRGHNPTGATLYVTLEPCCTHGLTPPCTDAIIAARIKRVIVGAVDPNPRHRGNGLAILRRAKISVAHGVLSNECEQLNEAFNHWIVHRTPFVTVKAAMTLDGKIATAGGDSKWITGPKAREYGMELRHGAGAILVGINTVLADDPKLMLRTLRSRKSVVGRPPLRRIILDSQARTPLAAQVLRDQGIAPTTLVVSKAAPQRRVSALRMRVGVLVAPVQSSRFKVQGSKFSSSSVNLRWLLKKLGSEGVTSLLVEGGGEVNASFLLHGLAHRITFFYAPKILGGRDARPAVGGVGMNAIDHAIRLQDAQWRHLGPDLLLTARILPR